MTRRTLLAALATTWLAPARNVVCMYAHAGSDLYWIVYDDGSLEEKSFR